MDITILTALLLYIIGITIALFVVIAFYTKLLHYEKRDIQRTQKLIEYLEQKKEETHKK